MYSTLPGSPPRCPSTTAKRWGLAKGKRPCLSGRLPELGRRRPRPLLFCFLLKRPLSRGGRRPGIAPSFNSVAQSSFFYLHIFTWPLFPESPRRVKFIPRQLVAPLDAVLLPPPPPAPLRPPRLDLEGRLVQDDPLVLLRPILQQSLKRARRPPPALAPAPVPSPASASAAPEGGPLPASRLLELEGELPLLPPRPPRRPLPPRPSASRAAAAAIAAVARDPEAAVGNLR